MLIIEGTDLVGKTTLCKTLVDELNSLECLGGYDYRHLSRLPPLWDFYYSYVSRMSRRVVQDRFHDSELAYSYGRGEDSPLDEFLYSLVEAQIRLFGGYKVLITCDTHVLKERYKLRRDDMYNLDVITRANEWFMDNKSRFDCTFHLRQTDEYVHPLMIRAIVDNYAAQQARLTDIIRTGGLWDYGLV